MNGEWPLIHWHEINQSIRIFIKTAPFTVESQGAAVFTIKTGKSSVSAENVPQSFRAAGVVPGDYSRFLGRQQQNSGRRTGYASGELHTFGCQPNVVMWV
jgi:hypothetical protein